MLGWAMAISDWDRTLPVPPILSRRAVAEAPGGWPGEAVEIRDGERTLRLYLPSAWNPGRDVELTINFHSVGWHAAQEHAARGIRGPLLQVSAGVGSRAYEALFADGRTADRWFEPVLQELRRRGAPSDARIVALDVSSFSAGYGAVRLMAKDPRVFPLLRRVVLADSLYGDLDPSKPGRVPAAEDVDVWLPLAQAAMRREKTFLITVSEVPTDYASSWECAAAIARAVGGELRPVEPGSCSATLDREHPLKARFDSGFLHIWGYGGADGPAHMSHVHHLADLWMALDRSKRV
ncbi:MAG TPA: hypothetical protein DER07_07545 [Armatimonadetes bacterium]|nr:hypothetical protein [Armatimonadota bacterium]HCE00882.1 hypothetical protein [Armatimonadota bacterium]